MPRVLHGQDEAMSTAHCPFTDGHACVRTDGDLVPGQLLAADHGRRRDPPAVAPTILDSSCETIR